MQETVVIAVVVDSTPPALGVESPSGEFGRDGDDVLVRIEESNHREGTLRLLSVSSGSEVAAQSPREAGTHRLAALLPLAEQRYRIEAQVEDLAGNRASLSREFEVDRTAPEVAITEPVEFAALNFDFHPGTMLAWLRASQLKPRQVRSLSYFRVGALKRRVPTRWLVGIDALLQPTGQWLQFSPSVFVRAQAAGDSPTAAPGQFFRCPACGSAAGLDATGSR